MEPLELLVRRVSTADPDQITVPVLRDLVRDVQTKGRDQIAMDAKAWTDNTWSQWRQHSSHNPW